MTFEEALESADLIEALLATVYAMNSLLIAKSIYRPKEFERLFVESIERQNHKKAVAK